MFPITDSWDLKTHGGVFIEMYENTHLNVEQRFNLAFYFIKWKRDTVIYGLAKSVPFGVGGFPQHNRVYIARTLVSPVKWRELYGGHIKCMWNGMVFINFL